MRGLVFTVGLAVLAAGAGYAQVSPEDRFDARDLTHQEIRTLQAALAFAGDYNGLFDGAWGKGSQSALEAYVEAEFGAQRPLYEHLVPLLQSWEEERIASGWQIMDLESTRSSYAHPFSLLTQNDDDEIIQFDAADDGLSLVVEFDDYRNTMGIHQYFLDEAMPFPAPYKSRKSDRIITSASLPGGLQAYVRSDAVDDGYLTLSIVAAKEHRGQMAVIAGSMQMGHGDELVVPPGGVLADLTGASEELGFAPVVESFDVGPDAGGAEAGKDGAGKEGAGKDGAGGAVPDLPPPASDAVPLPGGEGLSGSGTAFFVNNTDLVTAAHVVEGCSRMTFADGAELTVLQVDAALDLAVMTSAKRSADWLKLSAEVQPRLGETVMALGYPYLGDLGQGLTVTGGNISALQGIDGSRDRVMISAPVQPGNSGGPLLNARGAVTGVVVSRVDDMAIFDATGTLPQNMNFAVPNGPLVDFLRAQGVFFPQGEAAETDLAQGVPDAVSRAVVPVFCYQ